MNIKDKRKFVESIYTYLLVYVYIGCDVEEVDVEVRETEVKKLVIPLRE